MLDVSDDVELMGTLMGLMSTADVERGLELARIAGELTAISDQDHLMNRPILSDILQLRGEALEIAPVDVMMQGVGTRAISAASSDEPAVIA